MQKGSLARRLVVAGATVWFVRWLAAPIEAEDGEPRPLPAARDEWEFPEPKRPADPRTRRRRFASSLAFTAIFFAGAALAAGAGNVVVSEDSTLAAATDTTATTTDTTSTDAAAPAPDATAPAADPAPDTTTDAPADPAAPAATTADDPAVTPAPATTDATETGADPSTATATPPADAPAAPDPSDVTVKPTAPVSSYASAAKPAAHATRHGSRPVKHTQQRKLQNLPLVIPYHAIVFNPQAWLNDNPGTPTGQAAVALALNYLGVPYRWGGAVPMTGFDCSGLVRFVYAQLGVNLVHYAASQFASFPKLDPTQLAPGDLVFFEPKADGPGHVGMYIGHDQMIEAPHTGAVVRIASFSGAAQALGFLGAVRPYGAQAPALALLSTIKWGPAPAFQRLQ
jgi:cell wall-associated NlpC family hydrolase